MKKTLLLLSLLISALVSYADNKIYYKSSDGKIVTPDKTDVFGANIVSNTYKNGQGVITFDGEVTLIGVYAFNACRTLTSITIPSSVTSIGAAAFIDCSGLSSVEIPSSVTSIGYYAFKGCYGLPSITIPGSVKSIGGRAFYECFALKAVYLESAVPPTMGEDVFYNINKSTCDIYVPDAAAYAKYSSISPWNEFNHIYTEYDLAKTKCDTNDDGEVNGADVVRIYNFIVNGK